MSREAMQQALEALGEIEWSNDSQWQSDRAKVAIIALRQALETEQEPVAWTAMAFARLGEVRDKMRPDNVRIVQQFLDGDYTALGQTLKEKQEPVAWMYVNYDGECEQIEYGPVFDDPDVTPLYTAPPKQWVGLTEKEVKAIANKRNDYGLPMTGRMWVFVADLTDKLKEKNHG